MKNLGQIQARIGSYNFLLFIKLAFIEKCGFALIQFHLKIVRVYSVTLIGNLVVKLKDRPRFFKYSSTETYFWLFRLEDKAFYSSDSKIKNRALAYAKLGLLGMF